MARRKTARRTVVPQPATRSLSWEAPLSFQELLREAIALARPSACVRTPLSAPAVRARHRCSPPGAGAAAPFRVGGYVVGDEQLHVTTSSQISDTQTAGSIRCLHAGDEPAVVPHGAPRRAGPSAHHSSPSRFRFAMPTPSVASVVQVYGAPGSRETAARAAPADERERQTVGEHGRSSSMRSSASADAPAQCVQ
jgi:hypothetical protein